MREDHMTLTEHYEEFKEQGYTVFPDVFDPKTVEEFKQTYLRLREWFDGVESASWWFANVCELAPKTMLPAVSHPLLLDFAELAMGPFVQLDNLTLAGFPSVSKEEARGKVSSWHRDRYASFPTTKDYLSPLSINAICYLQDLSDDYGPLRVIPGSHRLPIAMGIEDRSHPRPDERVLYVKAGDVVMTHGSLVHSGTPNSSGDTRYFFSMYYNKSWLKHTDNYDGPNVKRIIKSARARNDHRVLRLFGVDDQLEARANSVFLEPDADRWALWAAADKAAVKAAKG